MNIKSLFLFLIYSLNSPLPLLKGKKKVFSNPSECPFGFIFKIYSEPDPTHHLHITGGVLLEANPGMEPSGSKVIRGVLLGISTERKETAWEEGGVGLGNSHRAGVSWPHGALS